MRQGPTSHLPLTRTHTIEIPPTEILDRIFIAIDRRILIQTDLKFKVNITGDTIADDVVFQWGRTDGLGQFPLNGLLVKFKQPLIMFRFRRLLKILCLLY